MNKKLVQQNCFKKHSDKSRKKAVTFVAALFLLLLYLIIFDFSGQDGEKSGGISRKVTIKCVEVVDNVANKNWTVAIKERLAELWEVPVRKCAHFMEYACMGMLVYIMWRPWKERDKKLFLLVALWVFLSATGDEIHQTFVPGRDGNFRDVLLDTAGGCFGLIVCVMGEKLVEKRLSGRNLKKKQRAQH
ncbi:MAG: VanZ family protein [Lachnospiraceae bacterium]|nr:VanZ family protein [Lachnospiraceae bacterium]